MKSIFTKENSACRFVFEVNRVSAFVKGIAKSLIFVAYFLVDFRLEIGRKEKALMPRFTISKERKTTPKRFISTILVKDTV